MPSRAQTHPQIIDIPARVGTAQRPRLTRQNAWRPRVLRRRDEALRNRFSLAKIYQLRDYSSARKKWRQLAVIVFFPLPSILASFVIPLVPLHDPTTGFTGDNTWTFMLLTFVTCILTFCGAMPQIRAAACISHDIYTNAHIVLVGIVSSVPLMGLGALVSRYWRFPVPFFWVLFAGPWLVCLAFGNAVVMRRHWSTVRGPLLAYAPSMAMQVAQIVIYPVYSAIFEASGSTAQILLILLFPFIKLLLKRIIFRLTRWSNKELSAEVALSSVEITSSMYQSIIMQTTPSALATVALIGVDVLHGLYEVKRFVGLGSMHAREDVIAALGRVLDSSAPPIVRDDNELSRYASRQVAVVPETVRTSVKRVLRSRGSISPAMVITNTKTAELAIRRNLAHALELLQSAEMIVLVEYIEVAVPLVNAVYLVFATQFKTVLYNPRLREFYLNPHGLRAAVASIVLYTSLQTVTLFVMGAALQYHLKFSAFTLLAFVLENHAWSLQGKLVPWLSVFFVFPIVHFGVDFTFKFEFKIPQAIHSS